MRLLLISWFIVITMFCSAQKVINFGEIKLPVRMTHTIGASISVGWNGLVGIGPTLQYYISPHVGLDAGAGIALSGYKFAGRVRYIFLEKNFSPIVGIGYVYSTGLSGQLLEISDSLTGTKCIVEILPSSLLQFVGGAELLINKGFFVLATMGYVYQINSNISLISGKTNKNIDTFLRRRYGSGPVIEFSIGYVFSNKGKYRGHF
jgi:hypothetical protein